MIKWIKKLFEKNEHDYCMVSEAVGKCFLKDENGRWMVGNHLMTTDPPPMYFMIELLTKTEGIVLLEEEAIKNVVYMCMSTWFRGELAAIYLRHRIVNTDVPLDKVEETKDSFALQFAKEFIKNYPGKESA